MPTDLLFDPRITDLGGWGRSREKEWISSGALSLLTAFAAWLDHCNGQRARSAGKEMSQHDKLTLRTGVQVYFAYPHRPWQRGSNENTHGLLRQYLCKGTDLSVCSQAELEQIALICNTRPRKRHPLRTPLQAYDEHRRLATANAATIH